MSKKSDFPQLGPRSHKNMVRIGIEIKIEQMKVERIENPLTHVGTCFNALREEPTRRIHAQVPHTKENLKLRVTD